MNTPENLPEEFLHYIWENRLYRSRNLKTDDGFPLEIIDPGKKNNDAGPDFFNAKIRLDSTIWIGNIEIHKKSSDWEKHNHHLDKAYENVILHVVEENDVMVKNSIGNAIPTLILDYPEQLSTNYQNLLDSKTWISCQNQFGNIDPVILQLSFNRLMIDRLQEKTDEICIKLKQNNSNWNETFYQALAKMFGFKVNAIPFEMLSKTLPLWILNKHKNNLFQMEALLFGNSGLLNEQLLGDDYFIRLRNEYSFLHKKYQLSGLEGHIWKFMRLRPANFPTIRISQFAALIQNSGGLFSKIVEIDTLKNLKTIFRVRATEYWDSHYNFNKPSKSNSTKELGEDSINTLITNTVVPFLFVFGEQQNKNQLKNRALDFLELLPPEKNSIVAKWGDLGISCKSAFETQSLLQLKNRFCESKKCLNCQIGAKLVKNNID